MKKTITALTAVLMALNNISIMAQNKITQTAGRNVLGEFAPKFAELNDDVLFGEAVWNDSTLSLHDHSMVTISILLGKGLVDSSFRSHLEMGKKHGITRKEIAALLTQAAFYAGWPNAWAGFRVAKEVWAEDDAATEKERFQQQMIFPVGEPNTAYAKYFTGNSYLAPISKEQLACRLTPPAGQPLKIIICRHALARLKINAYICRHDSGTSPAGAKGRAAKGRATQAKT